MDPYLANAPRQQNINPESMPQSSFITPKANWLSTTEDYHGILAQLKIHDFHYQLGFQHCSNTCVLYWFNLSASTFALKDYFKFYYFSQFFHKTAWPPLSQEITLTHLLPRITGPLSATPHLPTLPYY